MLRKSVETRDWVNTIEPRNVRAVMKRVVEDTTSIDVQVNLCVIAAVQLYSLCRARLFTSASCALLQVGLLYEEGVRKAHSSDSSKRTFSVYSSSRQQARYAASYTPRYETFYCIYFSKVRSKGGSLAHIFFSKNLSIPKFPKGTPKGSIEIYLSSYLSYLSFFPLPFGIFLQCSY